MQYQKLSDILSKMLLAVAISDEVILPNEINYILQKGGGEVLKQKINFTKLIQHTYTIKELENIKNNLIHEAIKEAQDIEIQENEVILLVIELLLFTDLDIVLVPELNTIYNFASQLIDITKEAFVEIGIEVLNRMSPVLDYSQHRPKYALN
jgi:dephospho-CoA kinase